MSGCELGNICDRDGIDLQMLIGSVIATDKALENFSATDFCNFGMALSFYCFYFCQICSLINLDRHNRFYLSTRFKTR